jgi:hypothetical protein
MMNGSATDETLRLLPPEVVSQFCGEAATAVGELAGAATAAADAYRRNDLKAAGEMLSALPGELRNFIVMIGITEQQLGFERSEVTIDDLSPADQISRLGDWLESLVGAQANNDPLTIADILEYDLEPFLRAWQGLLAARTSG